jgi:hypothetical protein
MDADVRNRRTVPTSNGSPNASSHAAAGSGTAAAGMSEKPAL